MKVVSDFHLHSRFSRACSKQITVANLEKWARVKGLDLLGTGDFTHPEWLKELKTELEDDGTGVLKTKSGFNFILQVEISNIYSQGGKGRRVHSVIMAPSFEVVDQINSALLKRGRLDYDGRPIFGFSCIELVEIMKSIDDSVEIIPAHIWTPWFSVFGSKSGFNSIEECFQDQAKHIHALETGLSSDPPMNWRLSKLDKYTLVSNSDSHSFWPWRIGREANVFDVKEITYGNFIKVLRDKDPKSFLYTIEVEPSYGKYHLDGHRNCGICLEPSESRENRGICPKCGRPLTIGVLNRVEELADREVGYKPRNAIPFKSLIPLSEIISNVLGINQLYSKKIWDVYNKLVKEFGSELNVLLDVDSGRIENVAGKRIAEAVMICRNGAVKIRPGFDGVYGKPLFEGAEKHIVDKDLLQANVGEKQKNLVDF